MFLQWLCLSFLHLSYVLLSSFTVSMISSLKTFGVYNLSQVAKPSHLMLPPHTLFIELFKYPNRGGIYKFFNFLMTISSRLISSTNSLFILVQIFIRCAMQVIIVFIIRQNDVDAILCSTLNRNLVHFLQFNVCPLHLLEHS